MVRRLLVVVLALALLAGAGVTGSRLGQDRNPTASAGDAAASGSAEPGVCDCGAQAPVPRPRRLTLACGDGNVFVHDIAWRHWASDLAVGVRTLPENDCDPNCPQGAFADAPAVVVLYDVVVNGAGVQFTQATVTHEHAPEVLTHPQTHTFSFAPYQKAS